MLVTPEVLANASSELGNISSEMKTITDNMNALIKELNDSWKDEYGKIFITRFEEEVASKFSNYYNLVAEYSRFIKDAHDTYEASIANIKSSVTSTRA